MYKKSYSEEFDYDGYDDDNEEEYEEFETFVDDEFASCKYDEKDADCAKIEDALNSMGFQLFNVADRRLLTPEEEKELVVKSQNGSKEAFDELITRNLGLVVFHAKFFVKKCKSMEIQDLAQEGCMGLMTAARKFDVTKNNKFGTYASYWIRETISRAIDQQEKIIRRPVYVEEMWSKLNTYKARYLQKHGQYPSREEIKKNTGLSFEDIDKLENTPFSTLSTNTKTLDDEKEFEDNLTSEDESTEDKAIRGVLKDTLIKFFDKYLNSKENFVLRNRFGFNDSGRCLTHKEIGELGGFSRERSRQLEAQAIIKLNTPSCKRALRDFLD